MKKLLVKILVKLTVIPMLFVPLLCGSVIFWQKDLGAKAAHKMLVKLTPGGQWQTYLKCFNCFGLICIEQKKPCLEFS
jgi:hypothetical protein